MPRKMTVKKNICADDARGKRLGVVDQAETGSESSATYFQNHTPLYFVSYRVDEDADHHLFVAGLAKDGRVVVVALASDANEGGKEGLEHRHEHNQDQERPRE